MKKDWNESDNVCSLVLLVEIQMGFINLIPKWVLAALLALLSATSCKLKYDKDGLALEIEKHKVAALELENKQKTMLAQAYEDSRKKEATLAAKVTTLQEEKDVQVTALTRQRDDLRKRLYAAARQAGTDAVEVSASVARPSASEAVQRSDGTQLLGTLGYDLVTEAFRADTIRLQLEYCERQYKEVEDASNKTEP